ncbi:hypothetical protein GCM10007291_22610 [Gemmobacter nanjingensis]|uniref:Uncharacterized protein n=2 Tax=Gemmobacter nanjingensis TaxID=488454 RepID=A0ABQ3FG16_9RHOB|nr:hypothetical protein GCM10007291_22610 [Gemmobacter nanjingensis]
MGLITPTAFENLIISKPDLQVGLTEVIPTGEIPTHYINRYMAEDEVRCAFCDKHTPHKRGFTAQMADGRIALCGRDCAAKYFGQEVADRFEQDLEKQIERAARRRIVHRTIEGVPATLALLSRDVVEMEERALRAVGALHDEFRATPLPTRLAENGDLEITETKRRWIEREDENGQIRRVPIDDTRVVLRVAAASVLRNGPTTKRRFKAARSELEMLAGVKTLDGWSDQVIDRMAQKRAAIVTDIQNGVRFINLCRRFFTPDNIGALSDYFQSGKNHVERVRLQSSKGGSELVVTGKPYSFIDYDMSAGERSRRYRLPNFNDLPSEEMLLAALRDG